MGHPSLQTNPIDTLSKKKIDNTPPFTKKLPKKVNLLTAI